MATDKIGSSVYMPLKMTEKQDISVNGQQRVVETVLLSLTGDIDLRKVSELTTQLNVPGGDQLKKAPKKQ